jgi:hypothetical protein
MSKRWFKDHIYLVQSSQQFKWQILSIHFLCFILQHCASKIKFNPSLLWWHQITQLFQVCFHGIMYIVCPKIKSTYNIKNNLTCNISPTLVYFKSHDLSFKNKTSYKNHEYAIDSIIVSLCNWKWINL